MCHEPIEGKPLLSSTFDAEVCEPCSQCCRDAEKQIRHYGKRAGIEGCLTTPGVNSIPKIIRK
jgi:hypothetical protein